MPVNCHPRNLIAAAQGEKPIYRVKAWREPNEDAVMRGAMTLEEMLRKIREECIANGYVVQRHPTHVYWPNDL